MAYDWQKEFHHTAKDSLNNQTPHDVIMLTKLSLVVADARE